MRTVRVTRFGGPEVLERAEAERPAPISTEVLVRVRAAGVNPVDAKTRRGEGVARWLGPPPFVLGWDVAGVVEEVGYGAPLAPGEEVFGMPWFPRAAGAYGQYVAAPSRQFARLPRELSMVEAAALPLAALTAQQSLDDFARIDPGQVVLITGASGGVGHLAVQLARARGATVIAAARPANHAFLRELGADEVVNREELPAASADVVLELAGGAHTRAALDALRPGGVLVAIPDGATDEVKAEAAARDLRVAEPLVQPDGAGMERIADLVRRGALRVAIEDVMPLADARRAHERLEAGGRRGKLVLAVP